MANTQTSIATGRSSVLCLIDFSASSENALRAAVQLAVKNAAHITILYPYRLTTAVKKENLVKLKRDIDLEALRNFEKISHLLDGTNIDFDFRSEVGFLSDRIQEHLRLGNIKLIVLNKGLADSSFEALAELVPHLQVPLILVPDGNPIAL